MSTLVTNKYNRKTTVVYLAVTILTVIVERIYSFFSHDVASGYMTWMFLYPFIGGAFYYLLIGLLLPRAHEVTGYRLFYNLYNSGIALLTVGNFMQGIFEIAGTNSPYVKYYFILGAVFCGVGIIVMLIIGKRIVFSGTHTGTNKESII